MNVVALAASVYRDKLNQDMTDVLASYPTPTVEIFDIYFRTTEINALLLQNAPRCI